MKVLITRVLPSFALALGALCLSIVSGQRSMAKLESGREAKPMQEPVAVVATPAPAVSDALAARPPLVLAPVNGREQVMLVPERDDGGFSDEDLKRAAIAFCQQTPGRVHPLAPRLLDLVYRAMRHFDAKVVYVVSGYRSDRAGSRHTQGRAVDLTLDGVANAELAAFVRGFGFVGVGLYPKRFVHLDVREASYFWTDDSAPDEPSRIVPVLEKQAHEADAQARTRGEAPDIYVPDNRKEDAAAAKVYAERAEKRRSAAPKRSHAEVSKHGAQPKQAEQRKAARE